MLVAGTPPIAPRHGQDLPPRPPSTPRSQRVAAAHWSGGGRGGADHDRDLPRSPVAPEPEGGLGDTRRLHPGDQLRSRAGSPTRPGSHAPGRRESRALHGEEESFERALGEFRGRT